MTGGGTITALPDTVWLDCIELARPRPAGWERLPRHEGGVSDVWLGMLVLDGKPDVPVYMKDISGIELAKELIGTALATAAEIPVPRAFLVFAYEDEFPAQHAPQWPDTGEAVLFATFRDTERAWKHVEHGGKAVKDALHAWSKFPDLVAFDEWVANGDRHDRNLLFAGADEFLAIDHARILAGPAWPGMPLTPRYLCQNRLFSEVAKPVPFDCRARIARGAAPFALRVIDLDLPALLRREPLVTLLPTSELDEAIRFLGAKRGVLASKVADLVGLPELL